MTYSYKEWDDLFDKIPHPGTLVPVARIGDTTINWATREEWERDRWMLSPNEEYEVFYTVSRDPLDYATPEEIEAEIERLRTRCRELGREARRATDERERNTRPGRRWTPLRTHARDSRN